MRIAVVDEKGEALGLAVALTRLGHDVHHVACVPAFGRLGLGLVSKAPSLMALMPESLGIELYAIFARGLSVQAAALRRRGAVVVGGNAWVERLEHDAAFASGFAESCGMRTPETKTYATPDEALAAVRADPRRYVVRAGNQSFSSDVPELLGAHIRRLQGFPIQVSPYIHGVEIYVETWFREGKNVFTLSALENGRFLDGELGPSLSPQTSVAWRYPMLEPRVYQNVTKKLEVLLAHEKHTGPVGARLVISDRDRKPYLLGFSANSARHVHALRGALGFNLPALVFEGHRPEGAGFAYAATVSVQPYPSSAPGLAAPLRGLPILGGKFFHPHDVEADPDRVAELAVAGTSGLLGDVVGVGASVDDARRDAVRTLDCILVEGKQARRGGGAARMARDVARLAALGYETPRAAREVAA